MNPYETGNVIAEAALATAPHDEQLPQECRGSWYCPCATERHERAVRRLARSCGADRVYDLGAGDLRLSVALSDDYDVIAYELNDHLLDTALEYWDDLSEGITLRRRDYYEDWQSIREENAVFAAIGKTNKLPGWPANGVGIEGKDDLRIVMPERP